jgi:hypothetical protein
MNYLLDISVRSLVLAALAAACICRVKSPSVKHAVWTVITAGMLAQGILGPGLPPLSLPLLSPVEAVVVPAATVGAPMPVSESPHPARWPILPAIYIAGVCFFAARLVIAYWYTRRLVRRSVRVVLNRYESRELAVPVTVGSKILLPQAWSGWDEAKLRAVVAHEEAHVRRHDSVIALLAHLNRCVFWFHPLAWWLERELAGLAEQACDDDALATQDREQYARVLLDLARVVHASQGRLLTLGMAKEAGMDTRIDRILDESRRIPKPLGRAGWAALLVSAVPLIYIAAAAQLAPAQILMQVPVPATPQPPQLLAPAATPPAPQPSAQPQPQTALRETYREWLDRQVAQFQQQSAQQPEPGAPQLSVEVSPERSVTLRLPLDPTVEHEVYVRIVTLDRRFVWSADRTVTGGTCEMQVSLKAGMYHVSANAMNLSDRSKVSRQFDIEVK